MSTISPSIIRGLSTLIPDKVNLIAIVHCNNVQMFLALARDSFYFVDMNLEKYVKPPIPYEYIEACKLCMK